MRRIIVVLVALGCVVTVVALVMARPLLSRAQDNAQVQAGSMAEMLTELAADEVPFTLALAVGGTLDVGGENALQIARVGTDFVCVAVPAETNTRLDCTPYSNVTAVIFSQPAG